MRRPTRPEGARRIRTHRMRDKEESSPWAEDFSEFQSHRSRNDRTACRHPSDIDASHKNPDPIPVELPCSRPIIGPFSDRPIKENGGITE